MLVLPLQTPPPDAFQQAILRPGEVSLAVLIREEGLTLAFIPPATCLGFSMGGSRGSNVGILCEAGKYPVCGLDLTPRFAAKPRALLLSGKTSGSAQMP